MWQADDSFRKHFFTMPLRIFAHRLSENLRKTRKLMKSPHLLYVS